jgi:GTP-binding protein
MIPVIALVGRPNVGKSTLFNYLTRSRDALVADMPGLTRDRKYGRGKVGNQAYFVVDTGGLSGEAEEIDQLMAGQTRLAIEESDIILFMVDGREGLSAGDENIAVELRKQGKPVFLVVNKTDGINAESAAADFYSLGIGDPLKIAASHGRGVQQLMDHVLSSLSLEEFSVPEEKEVEGIKIAIIGRPNVGKSTLVNRFLGEDRVLAYDMPGTTRDSIFIPLVRDGKPYTLIDTAGVRRRSKVHDAVEKFSVIKAMQAIEASNVVIVVLDAQKEISDQDATLFGYVLDSGRALVIAVNKWDGLSTDQKDRIRSELDRKLSFLDFARMHFISALHGTNIGHLFDSVCEAYESANLDIPTPELTRILEQAVMDHQPPLVHGRRIKLRYAHQGGRNPPIIVIHGNQVKSVPETYKRYLINYFRKALKIVGTPIRVEFKGGENPYEGKKNVLTKRQVGRKKRLMKHVKSRKKK